MAQIQQWTFQTCFVCLVAGMLDYLCEGMNQKKVLKFVLTLYILVTALVHAGDNVHLIQRTGVSQQIQSIQTPDTSKLAVKQAQEQLGKQLSERYGTPIQITLAYQGQQVWVQQVKVFSQEALSQVGKSLEEELGIAPVIGQPTDGGESDERVKSGV